MATSKTQHSKNAFGKRLTAARVAKNLTKQKLGELVAVHHSQIGRYEKGEASPAAEVLKKMANALDVTTDFLMNGSTSDLAAENIQDKTLINQFNRITEISYPLHQPLVFLQIIRVHLWRYGFKNNGTDNAGSYCIV
jgi:transcriptional regulator with XRE-family HTH domain